MNKNLRKCTPGENLWLYRKHRDLRQEELAVKFWIGRTTYWKMETDQMEFELKPHYRLWAYPGVPALLHLARRRSGWTLRQTARRVGVSHVRLLEMEREAHAQLLAFWLNRGWAF